MGKDKLPYIAYAIVWVAVSVAVIVGLIITKNANCLWAFCLPAWFVNLKVKSKSEDTAKKEENSIF